MKKYLSLFLLLVVGCRTINYTDKSGNSLKINSFLWDTSIGSMTASNGQDTLTVTNYNSSPDQQSIQLADDVVKTVATFAVKAPATQPAKP